MSLANSLRDVNPNITQMYFYCGKYQLTVYTDSNGNNNVYTCGVALGKGAYDNPSNETFFDCGSYNVTYNYSSIETYEELYQCGGDWAKSHKNGSIVNKVPSLFVIMLFLQICLFISY
ncbi:uncharacterized protein RJT20DRAFT_126259 [Scheffersomyces xylosifermentans]|uniref:uncharacterized protein n=1 Tax=Scheffersomyces xylosifermentans TaxID=1304137 RepID=UPI00315DA414